MTTPCRGAHPWTMAYWYAVGRNDERAGRGPGQPHNADYADPVLFADWYQRLHDDYHDPTSDRFSLPCIPDCFTEWLETAHARG